jgi:hypothetical protein
MDFVEDNCYKESEEISLSMAEVSQEAAAINSQLLREIREGVTQGHIMDRIEMYKGDPNTFRSWLRNIENQAAAANIGDAEKKRVVLGRCEDPIATSIRIRVESHPTESWVDFKTELTRRYGGGIEPQYLLKDLKQNKNQSVQVFGDAVRVIAMEAYSPLEIDSHLVQKQLVDKYINGLLEGNLKRKLARKQPTSLQQAISWAVEEDSFNKNC